MATRNMWTISKVLLKALKYKHKRYFTVSIKQFVGREQESHNIYILSEAVLNPETNKYYNKEFYSTASMIRIVLYLKDILDMLDGNPVSLENEIWNEAREELQLNGKYWSRDFCTK